MGVAGTTAWRVVHEYAQVGRDDRVLVLGAGGGVGSLLVPLARNTGATVWGQVGDPGKRDFVRARGAAEVVLADAAGLAAAVTELAPTVVLDPLGDGFFAAAIEALEQGGRLVSFGTSAGPEVTFNAQRLYRKGLAVRGYNSLGIAPGPSRRRAPPCSRRWQPGGWTSPSTTSCRSIRSTRPWRGWASAPSSERSCSTCGADRTPGTSRLR